MKKIGEYTARGTIQEAGPNPIKISLFDGKFDTAYRVKSIIVAPKAVTSTSNYNYAIKVMTREDGDPTIWNWGDQSEVAWSYTSYDANGITNPPFSHVDEDQLIVEDIYVYLETTQDLLANYEVVLEKYSISDWQGALAMARERQTYAE